MKVLVQSTFNFPVERFWDRLTQTQTLGQIAFPILRYVSLKPEKLPIKWRVLEHYEFSLRLLGVLPAGYHRVCFTSIDPVKRTMSTSEAGGVVKCWEHRMRVQSLAVGQTKYTDEVTISAGLMTVPLWLFAQLFYRYRHLRWKKLIDR